MGIIKKNNNSKNNKLSNKTNRREFLQYSLIGAAGLASGSLLSGCSTFDEYLFDDRRSFSDEVMIVGGGISGLYLAYKLRDTNTEFRIFEGSHTFGGRIKSNAGMDYGASVISKNDVLVTKLADKFSLSSVSLTSTLVKQLGKKQGAHKTKDLTQEFNQNTKNLVYFTDGMQSLTDMLFAKIGGLLPYRNFKLRWRLVEISKNRTGFDLVFESPSGQKRVFCKKIALAIPPNQWASIKGLFLLPEMDWAQEWLNTLSIENSLKLILPQSATSLQTSDFLELTYEGMNLRQILKKNKKSTLFEIDIRYPIQNFQKNEISNFTVSDAIRKKLQSNFTFQKLPSENFYDWSQIKLIGGSRFTNSKDVPQLNNPNFQIVGDFTKSNISPTIEEALRSATRASQLLL